MSRKTVLAALLVLALVLSVTVLDAYAYGDKGAKGHRKGLAEKFFFKVHMILKNRDELGLSDKQAKDIKDLKIKTKKDLIRKKAEIDILALDIKAAMWGKEIDTNAVNKLIDAKYDLKKAKAKSLVGAYAAVKGILTDGQKAKLKSIWKKCKKKTMHDSKMKGGGKRQKSGKR